MRFLYVLIFFSGWSGEVVGVDRIVLGVGEVLGRERGGFPAIKFRNSFACTLKRPYRPLPRCLHLGT